MGDIVICPLKVNVSKRRHFILNLNGYRNAHYRTLSASKSAFFEAMKSQVKELPGWHRVSVRFTMFPQTKRRMDISNTCSIIDKYLMDVVVALGKLPDDDYRHVIKVSYHYGGVDKLRPRVEAEFIDEDI